MDNNNVEYLKKNLKVYIADIAPSRCKREELDTRMEELEKLVYTYNGIVIMKKVQKKYLPDYNTYIWGWKLEEIMMEMEEEKPDILIIWNILKPHQVYNVNEKLRPLWVKAWDRVDLILKIFEKNAISI